MAELPRLQEIPAVTVPNSGPYDPELQTLVMRALRDIGFLYVEAPHIQVSMPGAHAAWAEYFSLPDEIKERYTHPEISYQRGHTPLYKEVGIYCQALGTGGVALPDKKECFMAGPAGPSSDRSSYAKWRAEHLLNVWPAEVPNFQFQMVTLYCSLLLIGRTVLRIIEEPLGLPAGYFDGILHDGQTVMRAIHYPPFDEEDFGTVVPACRHKDINLLTVLPPSTAGTPESGLWIKRRYGDTWIKGVAPKGHVIVQVGDMLQYLTQDLVRQGRLKGHMLSAAHEVRPTPVTFRQSRYSTALFIHPRYDVHLTERQTAGQFLLGRLKKIKLSDPGVTAY